MAEEPKTKATKVVEEVEEKQSVAQETAAKVEAKTTAKAGKRSAKSIEAAEEKVAKEERNKSSDKDDAPKKPKQTSKPTRSKLERRAKGYKKNAEKVQRDKQHELKEAVSLAKSTSHVKFDATVELHVRLNVDPRQADQNIRDNLVLPNGTGKTVKIAVLTDEPAEAKKAGADLAGTDDLFALLDKGQTDFDVLISTPVLMSKLGKYARILGPRGLMPNPKSGTVTTDINKAIAEAKAGKVEYRVDTTGIVHLGVGKVSFEEKSLIDNIQAVLDSLKSNKPQSVKGTYVKSAYITTSMGPSISLDFSSIN